MDRTDGDPLDGFYVRTTLVEDGRVVLEGLPFRTGESMTIRLRQGALDSPTVPEWVYDPQGSLRLLD